MGIHPSNPQMASTVASEPGHVGADHLPEHPATGVALVHRKRNVTGVARAHEEAAEGGRSQRGGGREGHPDQARTLEFWIKHDDAVVTGVGHQDCPIQAHRHTSWAEEIVWALANPTIGALQLAREGETEHAVRLNVRDVDPMGACGYVHGTSERLATRCFQGSHPLEDKAGSARMRCPAAARGQEQREPDREQAARVALAVSRARLLARRPGPEPTGPKCATGRAPAADRGRGAVVSSSATASSHWGPSGNPPDCLLWTGQ